MVTGGSTCTGVWMLMQLAQDRWCNLPVDAASCTHPGGTLRTGCTLQLMCACFLGHIPASLPLVSLQVPAPGGGWKTYGQRLGRLLEGGVDEAWAADAEGQQVRWGDGRWMLVHYWCKLLHLTLAPVRLGWYAGTRCVSCCDGAQGDEDGPGVGSQAPHSRGASREPGKHPHPARNL
jgi:hypothetical protein